jgi:mannitol 2-dehydrogenase
VYLDDLQAFDTPDHPSWSIIGTGVMPTDLKMADLLEPQDCRYVLVERSAEGAQARIVESISGFSRAVPDSSSTLALMSERSTSIVSLTVTEGGYPMRLGVFESDETLKTDLRSPTPRTTFGIIVEALDRRRLASLPPFTILSCDNLPGNGNVVRTAVLGAAAVRSDALATWIERNGAFPNSMVDRITPATTDEDRAFVSSHFGIDDAWPVTCEPFRQWALEDTFVTDRPRFEEVGVLMTTDVIPYEHMKLRLLNGSHSALAYHAALAGIRYVHDAVQDERIERFIRTLMKREVAPNLAAPAGIDLHTYQDSLVTRFSNPAIADTVARLCLDGTAKFPTFIVPSLEEQLDHNGPIDMLALVLAGWCRYLRGIDDNGARIDQSSDPFLDEAREIATASTADPSVFLRYERALGPNIGSSTRLIGVFTEALQSLDAVGSLETLNQWTRRSNG